MVNYLALASDIKLRRAPLTENDVAAVYGPRLVNAWLADYGSRAPNYDVVETMDEGFHYLFDIAEERLIAAWGLSKGKDESPRSIIATRMKGHPLTNTVGGKRYHRGHAIPHTLGGRTDINLVPQLGVINSGPFQAIEGMARDNKGSLYFTYWLYSDPKSQRPSGVEQGLLIPGRNPEVASFGN